MQLRNNGTGHTEATYNIAASCIAWPSSEQSHEPALIDLTRAGIRRLEADGQRQAGRFYTEAFCNRSVRQFLVYVN